MNVSVLAYADPTKLYELHVNAIRDVLSGVLYQGYDGHLWPVIGSQLQVSLNTTVTFAK